MANGLLDLAIPGAISLYDMYQRKNAVGDATNQGVAGYTAAQDRLQSGADSSLSTLLDVYNQSKKSLSPYYDFGLQGLQGYNNLMENPSSVTSNPGYQFRFDQGQQALERSAAAKGGLLSGNTGTALAQYGQNYAMDEYDRALARELPRIQTGTGATNTLANLGESYSRGVAGVYTGLGEGLAGLESKIGEARAGGTIGEASSTTGVLKDLASLYQLWSGGGAATGAAGAVGNATAGFLSGLTNAGGGSATAAAGLAAKETLAGTGSWADLSAGPRQAGSAISSVPTSPLSTLTGGASAAAGSLPAWYTAGATPATTYGGAYTTALGGTTPPASAVASTGSIAGLAAPIAMIGALKFLSSLKGGSVEGAKTGKLSSQLQADMQSDPTGAKAQATMDKLINNQLWPDEGNQWVIGDLLDSGALSVSYPGLHSSGSVFNTWENPTPDTNKFDSWRNEAFVKAANLSPAEKTEFEGITASYTKALRDAETQASEGGVSRYSRVPQYKAAYDAFLAKMEPRRQQNAQQIYSQLRSSGYTGDLSKLETYLGIR